jgi:uncharacterized protein YcfJ
MNMQKIVATGLFAWVAMSGSQSAFAAKKEHNTWVGVGVGALAGGLLSHGDPMAMLGGAAAGGLIGNVTTSNDRDRGRNRGRDDRYRNDRNDRNDRNNHDRNRRDDHRR